MNLSAKIKDLLFVAFMPYFCATSWPTFSSMSFEVAQKSDKKSTRYLKPLKNWLLGFVKTSKIAYLNAGCINLNTTLTEIVDLSTVLTKPKSQFLSGFRYKSNP